MAERLLNALTLRTTRGSCRHIRPRLAWARASAASAGDRSRRTRSGTYGGRRGTPRGDGGREASARRFAGKALAPGGHTRGPRHLRFGRVNTCDPLACLFLLRISVRPLSTSIPIQSSPTPLPARVGKTPLYTRPVLEVLVVTSSCLASVCCSRRHGRCHRALGHPPHPSGSGS
jgi:hypothetical protein